MIHSLDETTGEAPSAVEYPAHRTAFDRDPIDTLRADAFLAAILAAAPDADGSPDAGGVRLIASHVRFTVDAATLLRLADNPAELDGYGPIPPELARQLAADGNWQRMVTDPVSGHLLDFGQRTYRPPIALARYLRARDVTCRFPGCNRRARRADLDHAQPWNAGGATSAANMGGLCRRHHNGKTHGRWSVKSHADGGATFASPAGHEYRKPAVDHNPEHTAHLKRLRSERSQRRRGSDPPGATGTEAVP